MAPALGETQFGREGEGAGEFHEPSGIAVDNSGLLTDSSAGDVYLVDRDNNRVEKFTGKGEFRLAWGWGVRDGKEEPQTCGPEATPATEGCLKGRASSGAGQFEGADGVAVDSDSLSGSVGDVYVEDAGNNRVEKFKPDGEFVLMFGGEVNRDGSDVCVAGEECRAGVDAAGPGEFSELRGNAVTVDPFGSVYVGDENRVQEFGEDGALAGHVALAGIGSVKALAVDSAKDIYVMANEFTGVRKYELSGTELCELDPAAIARNTVLTLGSSGELFVDDESSRHVFEFAAGCVQVASFDPRPPHEHPLGLAFGKAIEGLYVLDAARVRVIGLPPAGPLVEAQEASGGAGGTATVRVSLNPEGHQTTYHVDYGLEVSSETPTETVTLAGEGFEGETVFVKLSGLQPAATYHFHVVAENTNGTVEGADETFVALPAVSIDSESVSQVSATSVRLSAMINPLGSATEYRFEYGPTTAYGSRVPVPDGSAGSGVGDVPFSFLVEGLAPGSTYHYRVVAHNPLGETLGADRVFVTQAGAGSGLIDGRGWELVSPPVKHGVALESITEEGGLIQAAENGDGVAYIAKAPIDAQPAGNRSLAEQQFLATHGAQGWSTQDIATEHEAVEGFVASGMSEYKFFSGDLSVGLVEPEGETPLSPAASERTPYRREANGQFLPLVYPGNVPPNTKFGAQRSGRHNIEPNTGVRVRGGSVDMSRVVVSSPQSLVEGFDPGAGSVSEQALYEWAGGTLTPVSVLPNGASAAEEGGAELGANDHIVRNAVSADGGRVFFETGVTLHLFVRDVTRSVSVRLDAPEVGATGGGSAAMFEDASSDGGRVFFLDVARLTVDATSEVGEPDLYMCDVAAVAPGEQDCSRHLTDLTVDADANEAANVLGAVIGVSSDGSYVYFVANGVLGNEGVPVTGAVHGDCVPSARHNLAAPAQSCNLYVWHDGVVGLVGVLSNRDSADWEANTDHDELGVLTSRVSPDGRWLAFMSQRSLTGYDNVDVKSGERDVEVFEFGAVSERVVCVSCVPSGARPAGVLEPTGSEPPLLVDRPDVWGEQWVAGSVPGWTRIEIGSAFYQSRFLSDEGRLFFDSPVGLVPGDGNGSWDVYEFEPEGVGGCSSGVSSASSVFVKEVAGSVVGGCVGLLSSGVSGEESAFLDASESGDDVFFLTAAKLVSADFDSALDVYDAHVCGSGWSCPSESVVVPPACSNTDSCRSAPAPQPEAFGAPPSATFSGPGNVVPSSAPAAVTRKTVRCKKGFVKNRKGKCVRKPKPKKRGKK